MRIHILGICGTFMGGVAALAKASGHTVTGSDAKAYPPMSTQLEALGVRVHEGYSPAQFEPTPDCVVVGNVMTRGNAAVEHMLDADLAYTSGPQWLAEHVLGGRHVLAVAGTHGKTTTSGLLAWILEHAGRDPGFLIGGVARNFPVSARLGTGTEFVVEADEYDSAFFDKRSKFVHYRPKTLVLNNLEYDHADIFPDLAAIQRQVHHLVRTVPANGLIVCNAASETLRETLALGCWTPVEYFSVDDAPCGGWHAVSATGGAGFELSFGGEPIGEAHWEARGRHNVENAVAAIAAARHAGVEPRVALDALAHFRGVKRRLEVRLEVAGITLYDDFAHHPTAIRATLDGLRSSVGEGRLIAVFEPRSNTMKMGVHRETLAPALARADRVWVLRPPGIEWPIEELLQRSRPELEMADSVSALVGALVRELRAGDHVVLMSNGDFGGLPTRLGDALRDRWQSGSEPMAPDNI